MDLDAYAAGKLHRNGIADLLVLVAERAFELPDIRKALDSRIFPDREGACLLWMAALGLFLGWRRRECQAGLVPCDTTCHATATATGEIALAHVFTGNVIW